MRIYKIIFLLLFIFLSLNSCMSKLDTEQVNDIEFKNEFNVSLVYFNLKETNFIDVSTGTTNTFKTDFTTTDIFKIEFIRDYLDRAILKIKIDNSFNKAFSINIILTDIDNNTLQIIPLNLNQNESSSLEIEYLKGTQDFTNLLETRKVAISVNMSNDSNVVTDDMKLKFQSAFDLFLTVKDE